ncbi:MAG: four helix bundle protein [Fimbriimonas ginsengisoli]|uniref:Four helix bundle protein n=1 Tax=Fimbriimonas ginsengisoli TaxID=1005039 RepID=A0A931PUJ9_FIMGI|nr:four helix bundle protein [Fimbriimonas ginsengisoli]
MGSYRDLEVWKIGRELVKAGYLFSEKLPESERFGLKSQIQRAAVSVPANIAEGAGRNSDPSFAQFARVALGSLNELDTLICPALDVGLASEADARPLVALIRDLSVRLRNLITRLCRADKPAQ